MSRWRSWANQALAGLFAPACVACQEPLAHPTEGAVCAACWDRLSRFTPPVCATCGPMAAWRVNTVARRRHRAQRPASRHERRHDGNGMPHVAHTGGVKRDRRSQQAAQTAPSIGWASGS